MFWRKMFWRKGNESAAWQDAMLDAYLDGELDGRQRKAVEVRIGSEPEAAEYVLRGRQLRHDLHRMFDRRFAEPLPPRHVDLAIAIDRRLHQRPARGWHARESIAMPLQFAAATAIAVVVLGAAGVNIPFVNGPSLTNNLFPLFQGAAPGEQQVAVEGALDATQPGGAVAPEATVLVNQPDETTAGEGSGGALDGEGGAPDFGPFGFKLIGARLLANQDSNSMQLVYEAPEGMRVELFYGPDASAGKTSLVLMEEGPISVLFWHAGGRSYSLVGEVARDTLLEMGRVVNGEWTASLPAADVEDGTDQGAPPTQEQSGLQNDAGAEPLEAEPVSGEATGDAVTEPANGETILEPDDGAGSAEGVGAET